MSRSSHAKSAEKVLSALNDELEAAALVGDKEGVKRLGDSAADSGTDYWHRLAVLAFCLFHSCAVLWAARPAALFYPPPPNDSGLTFLRDLELSTRSDQLQNFGHPRGPIAFYCRYFGVSQQWNTFAPLPPSGYAHYEVSVDTPDGSLIVWSDHKPIDRAGTGLFYDPSVKMLDMFRQRAIKFQDLFLTWQARRFQSIYAVTPERISLLAFYVNITIDAQGKPQKTPVKEVVVRSLATVVPK